MESYREKIIFIRNQLKLYLTPFRDIPDDFILLLFTSQTDFPTQTQRDFQRKYGFRDYESFEFIGDSVLSMMIVRILIELDLITSPRRGHQFKQLLTNNQSLGRLLIYKGLCQERIIGSQRYEQSKSVLYRCADVFEAIIGGLYWFLHVRMRHPNAMAVMQEWFVDVWPIHQIIRGIYKDKRFQCPTENLSQFMMSKVRAQAPAPALAQAPVPVPVPAEFFEYDLNNPTCEDPMAEFFEFDLNDYLRSEVADLTLEELLNIDLNTL